ncbi:MAG: hypothetical protein AAFY20_08360 [Cyanobacteria bacterium J06639_14]
MASTRSTPSWLRRLLHPSWLAGIISVGVHGGIFAAGPTFKGLNFQAIADLDLPEEQRQVPLIELTSAEQQRLPDFSQSFYRFENFGDLESVSPFLWGEGTGSSGLEKIPASSIPGGQAATSETPNKTNNSNPLFSGSLPSIPLLPPPISNYPASNPGKPPQEDTDTPATNPDVNDSEVPELESSVADNLENLPTEPSAEDLEAQAANPAEDTSQPSLDEFMAQGNSFEDLSPEQQIQAFTYDDARTDDEGIEERFEDWFLAGKAATGNLTIALVEEPIELLIPYGASGQCLEPEPHDGLIGAFIDAEGKLFGEPEILKSTGYLFLNWQAAQFIKEQEFTVVKGPAAYEFQVVVEYDSETCIVPEPGTNNAPETEPNDAANDTPEAVESSAPEGSASDLESDVTTTPETSPASINNAAVQGNGPDAGNAASPEDTPDTQETPVETDATTTQN